LSEIGGESVNTASLKREILESLKDREYRDAFKEENVFTSICFQIRALREQREKSQKELGRLVIPMMAPERISILEDPNAETKPTVATLLRLADAFDVGLDIRFVPFATVIDRSVHTDMKELEVQSFDKELPAIELAIEAELADKKDVARVGEPTDQWEMLKGKGQGEIQQEANASRGWGEMNNRNNPFERVA
jgi:transcriptional regulator with XRE-family HTH domain